MIIFTTLKRILFWSYERGTWQYDVMCVLILAFIFVSPNTLFEKQAARAGASETQVYVGSEEVDQINPARVAGEKQGHQITVSRYEVELDESGSVKGYVVWGSPSPNN
jgi:hypothetical protein